MLTICIDCEFWNCDQSRATIVKGGGNPEGECHCHPPVVVALGSHPFLKTAWPITKAFEGCGEGHAEETVEEEKTEDVDGAE